MKLGFAMLIMAGMLWSCSSSPLGPAITNRDDSATSGSGGSGSSGGGSSGSGSTVTCSRSSGHNVYYGGSTIKLVYTCDASVSSVTPSSAPSFLTSSISDKTVTFSGTAPSAASSNSWSFSVNSATTAGDAGIITTKVLATSGLAATLGTIDPSSNNDTAISTKLRLALDSTWDGSMSDVTLKAASVSGDLQGISSVSTSCSSSPYVCQGTNSTSSTTTRDAGVTLKWPWSAFDQGNYALTITPSVVIESGTTSLSSVSTTFTLPVQSAGNDALTSTQDPSDSTFDTLDYPYAIGFNTSSSTDVAPIMGLGYYSNNGVYAPYFHRIAVNRKDSPSTSPDGITEATSLDVSNAGNSSAVAVKSISSSKWVTLSARANGAVNNIFYNAITDSSSAPALTASGIELTSLGTGTINWVDMTDTFSDSGTTRFGYAFVRSSRYLVVAKGNPAGTTANTINDDSHFKPYGNGVGSNSGDFEIDDA